MSRARPGLIRDIVRATEARDEDAMAAACEYHVNQAARSVLAGLAEFDDEAADVLEALGSRGSARGVMAGARGGRSRPTAE